MALGFNIIQRSGVQDAVNRYVGQVTTIGGTLLGGVKLDVLTRASKKVEELREKAAADAARARGDIPDETKHNLLALFGGVSVATALIFAAVAVGAVLVLRR